MGKGMRCARRRPTARAGRADKGKSVTRRTLREWTRPDAVPNARQAELAARACTTAVISVVSPVASLTRSASGQGARLVALDVHRLHSSRLLLPRGAPRLESHRSLEDGGGFEAVNLIVAQLELRRRKRISQMLQLGNAYDWRSHLPLGQYPRRHGVRHR